MTFLWISAALCLAVLGICYVCFRIAFYAPPRKEKDPEALYRKCKAEGRPLPRFYLACGTEDSLLEANRDYRDFLKKEGADVCWEEGPGGHNWRFWNQYIDRGLRHFLG